MRFKTLMLSSSLLVFAALFSYCSKESTTQEPQAAANTDGGEANSRAVCKVLIEPTNGDLSICGTQANPNVCSGLVGDDFIPNGGSQLYIVNTPATLLLNRAGVNAVSMTVKVTTTTGNVVYPMPINNPLQININNLCNQ